MPDSHRNAIEKRTTADEVSRRARFFYACVKEGKTGFEILKQLYKENAHGNSGATYIPEKSV